MNFSFNMKNTAQLLAECGLQPYGRVQKFIDQECIRLMDPYTPRVSGNLIKSASIGTKIGSGHIEQVAPYARYLYYGKLMVSPLTGSSYAKKGESKVLTDKDLDYSKAANPQAGSFWFERFKTDHKEKILKGAQNIANRGGR